MASVLEFVREDDFIEYFLFPAHATETKSDETESAILAELKDTVDSLATDYFHSYLWHKDAFNVFPRYRNANLLNCDSHESQEVLPPHLHGITHYGDNIQDEWFIVSFLFELTRKIPSLIVRTIDGDGEFLLIEAAEHLPKWANPETCEQRVYIQDGQLFLIERKTTDQRDDVMAISTALALLITSNASYKMCSSAHNCIQDRLKNYPSNISEQLHCSVVYAPVEVAALLKCKPGLIGAAVRAFCNRDKLDMKACQAMRFFPPENRVYASVKFTKCMFAMLMNSKYLPDRRTGWNLPVMSSPNHKAHLLGVKLACGFEILAAQAKVSDDLESDRNWLAYVENLKKKGYFKELIEGSKEYKNLLNMAEEYFREHRQQMQITSAAGAEVLSLLKELEINTDDFSSDPSSLPASDSESWLNISAQELDDMLTKRYGVKKLFSNEGVMNAACFTESVNEFLEKESDFEGIDLESSSTTAQIHNNPLKENKLRESANVDFDPDAYQSQIKNLLDLFIPEDRWESNSDMSDYEDDDDLNKNIEDMADGGAGSSEKDIKSYMEQMDRELSRTTIGRSFETHKDGDHDEVFDDIENFKPVDIDMTTLKNMIDSYQHQLGGPGPASNLLNSIDIQGGISAKPVQK